MNKIRMILNVIANKSVIANVHFIGPVRIEHASDLVLYGNTFDEWGPVEAALRGEA